MKRRIVKHLEYQKCGLIIIAMYLACCLAIVVLASGIIFWAAAIVNGNILCILATVIVSAYFIGMEKNV